jgi:hypothetical protein
MGRYMSLVDTMTSSGSRCSCSSLLMTRRLERAHTHQNTRERVRVREKYGKTSRGEVMTGTTIFSGSPSTSM